MSMQMEIVFPGRKRVDALYRGFTIKTDQVKEDGGDGSAPEPFDLFLVSIGTCAGIYVLNFCQQREIPTDGMKLGLISNRNQETRMLDNIKITIYLPENFPKKYIGAVKKAANLCSVKKHILNPPQFEIWTE
jgi:putative redox protein